MATIKFDTTLYDINGWTIAKLPKEESTKLPSRSQIMAKGTLNGQDLLTALEPDGNWSHWFRVDDEMKQRYGVAEGDTITLELESTKNWPEPEIPEDWQHTLDTNDDIMAFWQRVTPMARWEWLRWINSTSNPETRKKRIEVSCDKLRKGMRRPCCFNRSMNCVPQVSKNGVLINIA